MYSRRWRNSSSAGARELSTPAAALERGRCLEQRPHAPRPSCFWLAGCARRADHMSPRAGVYPLQIAHLSFAHARAPQPPPSLPRQRLPVFHSIPELQNPPSPFPPPPPPCFFLNILPFHKRPHTLRVSSPSATNGAQKRSPSNLFPTCLPASAPVCLVPPPSPPALRHSSPNASPTQRLPLCHSSVPLPVPSFTQSLSSVLASCAPATHPIIIQTLTRRPLTAPNRPPNPQPLTLINQSPTLRIPFSCFS